MLIVVNTNPHQADSEFDAFVRIQNTVFDLAVAPLVAVDFGELRVASSNVVAPDFLKIALAPYKAR